MAWRGGGICVVRCVYRHQLNLDATTLPEIARLRSVVLNRYRSCVRGGYNDDWISSSGRYKENSGSIMACGDNDSGGYTDEVEVLIEFLCNCGAREYVYDIIAHVRSMDDLEQALSECTLAELSTLFVCPLFVVGRVKDNIFELYVAEDR